MIAARAVQLAAWNYDLHVSVNLSQLLSSEEKPRNPAEQAVNAPAAHGQPYRVIAWFLANRNVGLEDMVGLHLSAVTHDGISVTPRWDPSVPSQFNRSPGPTPPSHDRRRRVRRPATPVLG